ncbi:MAG: polysaccharide deacetylase family protein [Gammaproteobacteria bacterium]
MIRLGGSLLSRSRASASLLVMIYHRVLTERDLMMPSEPTAADFDAQMRLLCENFNVLPLREAAERLRAGTLPTRAVCVTFDDGYANNCEVALPILKTRGVPATVFVAPGFLNGGCMFNDTVIEALRQAPAEFDLSELGFGTFKLGSPASRMKAVGEILGKVKYFEPAQRLQSVRALIERSGGKLPTDLMMTDEQVRTLADAGIDIGAHTMNHPILASIDADTARTEILQSKRRLEEITGAPVRTFAYPNGKPERDYNRTHVTLAREAGFDLAVSTSWGAATAQSDPFQIPRIAPWDSTARRYAARMVNSYRQRQFQVA